MRSIRIASAAVVLVALTGLIGWQQARTEHLMAEAAMLREQLAQAAAAQMAYQRSALSQNNTSQNSDQDQFREVLRLRGQVGVLTRQLAELAKTNTADAFAPRATELDQQAKRPTGPQPDLAASDALLAEQIQKLDAAAQRVAELSTTLNVPEEVRSVDGAAALNSEDLKQYWQYFQARKELAETAQYTDVVRLKVMQDYSDAQGAVQTVPRQ